MLVSEQKIGSPVVVRATAILGLAAAVAMVVGMLALGHYSANLGRLLLTALALGLFASLALSPSIVRQRVWARSQMPWLGPAGMAAPVLGLLLVTIGIWAVPDSDAFWKTVAIVTILAVALSYCFWFLAYPPGFSAARRVAWASVGASASAGLLASAGVVFEIKLLPWWWAVSLLLLAMVAGGFAVPLVSFMVRRQK